MNISHLINMEDWQILSLGINRKVKREFIRRVRGNYDKNLKEFSLRMAYNFGGREYKSLCPERLLETSIKIV